LQKTHLKIAKNALKHVAKNAINCRIWLACDGDQVDLVAVGLLETKKEKKNIFFSFFVRALNDSQICNFALL
jgi:hypothetical protein